MNSLSQDFDSVFNLVGLCRSEAELVDLVQLKLGMDLPRLLANVKEYLVQFSQKHNMRKVPYKYANDMLEDLVDQVLSDDSLDSIELDESKIVEKVLMEL